MGDKCFLLCNGTEVISSGIGERCGKENLVDGFLQDSQVGILNWEMRSVFGLKDREMLGICYCIGYMIEGSWGIQHAFLEYRSFPQYTHAIWGYWVRILVWNLLYRF